MLKKAPNYIEVISTRIQGTTSIKGKTISFKEYKIRIKHPKIPIDDPEDKVLPFVETLAANHDLSCERYFKDYIKKYHITEEQVYNIIGLYTPGVQLRIRKRIRRLDIFGENPVNADQVEK